MYSSKILKFIFLLLIIIAGGNLCAQSVVNIFEAKVSEDFENIKAQPLHSDELGSSFIIWVKEEVKMHKHFKHSEQVLILEGEGMMTVGHDKFKVKSGDMISIPKGVAHGVVVTSDIPLKVLSMQTPEFLGKDRFFIE